MRAFRLLAVLAGALLVLLSPVRTSAQALTVVADTASPLTALVSPEAFAVRFTVAYLGADSVTVQVVCDGGGAVECVTPASRLQLGPGETRFLAFGVRAQRPGRGLVMVRVRDPVTGARASEALLITVTP